MTAIDESLAKCDANSKNASPAASRWKQPIRQLKRKSQRCDRGYKPDDDNSDDCDDNIGDDSNDEKWR
jgi:hypothetical protein